MTEDHDGQVQPSPFLNQFARKIVAAASGHPIIDIGCGSGRNAFHLVRLGAFVICIDKDTSRFRRDLIKTHLAHRLTILKKDVVNDPWEFKSQTVGGAILVDYLERSVLEKLYTCLIPGGQVLIETVGNRGGNYLELPKAGELRTAFEHSFKLQVYRERKAGPQAIDAVTVRMLASRR